MIQLLLEILLIYANITLLGDAEYTYSYPAIGVSLVLALLAMRITMGNLSGEWGV